MALATSFRASMAFRCLLPSSPNERVLMGQPGPVNLVLHRSSSSRSILAFARRRNHNPAIASSSKRRKEKKSLPQKHVKEEEEEEDLDEDAFESLFSQLEEDLKNDNSTIDDANDEINEEDIERFARQLEEVLGVGKADLGMLNLGSDDIEGDNDSSEEEGGGGGDDDDERTVTLKNWQLRRLAVALKTGRRKTKIKSLAVELCLDRAFVLKLLTDPPPQLLMMSAALPDKPKSADSVRETNPVIETVTSEISVDAVESVSKKKDPVHVMNQRWSAQKRLKKVQVETLERVYKRSKRPTNAMISSIVQVTNLPRKRVLKWFEDKRTEDGVPDQHLPYQRSPPETVFS